MKPQAQPGKLKWHELIVFLLLVASGALSVIVLLHYLVDNPGAVPFDVFLLALAVPVLTLLAAYFLLKRSEWLLLVLALLPFTYLALAWNLQPSPPVYRSIERYFASLSGPFRIATGFYVLCFIYSVFLKKWSGLK